MKIDIIKYRLNFRFEAGTSRGVLTSKDTYFIKLYEAAYPKKFGLGECAPLPDLSPDLEGELSGVFSECSKLISSVKEENMSAIITKIPNRFPALRFGLETAFLDYKNGGTRLLFRNDFSASRFAIPINGLVWMGDKNLMLQRLKEKIEDGYRCIKIKIGGIDFQEELDLLGFIRKYYSAEDIVIRLDANGAFHQNDALRYLEQLAVYDIHSIEQPIKQGDWEVMGKLCENSPIPIALDEELIGIHETQQKINLLESVNPPFIILKPTLLGGFEHCREWITLAEARNIDWWITSALESNIGLNAIAQFTANYPLNKPQGLGTGQLFHNNIPSPLETANGFLRYNEQNPWDLSGLF